MGSISSSVGGSGGGSFATLSGAATDNASLVSLFAQSNTPIIDDASSARNLALADLGSIIRGQHATNLAVTIQPYATVAYTPLFEQIFQKGHATGEVSVVAGSGVTINAPGGLLSTYGLGGVGARLYLKNTDTNVYTLTRVPQALQLLTMSLDGGGSPIATGEVSPVVVCPYAGTIVGWSLSADTGGSVTVDVWNSAYSADTDPTVSNTIITGGGTKPSTSSHKRNYSTSLTGWTTAVAQYSLFKFKADTVSSATKITLQLWIQQ